MCSHYTPTKAGIVSMMQSCAIALGKYNIRCNAILPGTIATDINKEDLANEEKREYTIKRTVLGRLGGTIQLKTWVSAVAEVWSPEYSSRRYSWAYGIPCQRSRKVCHRRAATSGRRAVCQSSVIYFSGATKEERLSSSHGQLVCAYQILLIHASDAQTWMFHVCERNIFSNLFKQRFMWTPTSVFRIYLSISKNHPSSCPFTTAGFASTRTVAHRVHSFPGFLQA